MVKKTAKLPWTHFVMESTVYARAFTLDQCENCYSLIQASNAVRLNETQSRLLELGLKEMNEVPPEGYHDDVLEGEACDMCQGRKPLAWTSNVRILDIDTLSHIIVQFENAASALNRMPGEPTRLTYSPFTPVFE